jgi:hypothetical protein
MHQQLWGYKVEKKLYVGVRVRKRLNITASKDNDYLMLQQVELELNVSILNLRTLSNRLCGDTTVSSIKSSGFVAKKG